MEEVKIKFNFKDGRRIVQEFPINEDSISEFYKLVVRGKINNAEIKTKDETLRYEDVLSVELLFE